MMWTLVGSQLPPGLRHCGPPIALSPLALNTALEAFLDEARRDPAR